MAELKKTAEETLETENIAVEENTGAESESGGDEESQDAAQELPELIAIYPILYLSRQYKVGEVLPSNDPEMVSAWLDAKTAAWLTKAQASAKAKSMGAGPGKAGIGGRRGDLVGRIPKTPEREKK